MGISLHSREFCYRIINCFASLFRSCPTLVSKGASMSLICCFCLLFFISLKAAHAQSFTLTATVVADGIDLSWSEVSGAAGYDLYFCEYTGSMPCTVPTSGGANPPYLGWIATGTAYEHRGLSPGTKYRYQVTHYVGGTVRSNVEEATAPELQTFTLTATVVADGIDLAWSEVSGAPGYDL